MLQVSFLDQAAKKCQRNGVSVGTWKGSDLLLLNPLIFIYFQDGPSRSLSFGPVALTASLVFIFQEPQPRVNEFICFEYILFIHQSSSSLPLHEDPCHTHFHWTIYVHNSYGNVDMGSLTRGWINVFAQLYTCIPSGKRELAHNCYYNAHEMLSNADIDSLLHPLILVE